jgi:hypothetical protein
MGKQRSVASSLCIVLILAASACCVPSLPTQDEFWNSFKPSYRQNALKAAVHTPYGMAADELHKYMLHVGRALQSLGYNLTVVVPSMSGFSTTDDALRLSRAMHVDLRPDMLRVAVAHSSSGVLTLKQEYTLFVSIGKTRHPTVSGAGLVNFYLCVSATTSNIDLQQSVGDLASYDYVLLKSQEAYILFSAESQADFIATSLAGKLVPQLEVLEMPYAGASKSPAAITATAPSPNTRSTTDHGLSEHQHVCLVTTAASSNRTEDKAVNVFRNLQHKVPQDVQLIIVHICSPAAGGCPRTPAADGVLVLHATAGNQTVLQQHLGVCKVCWLMPVHRSQKQRLGRSRDMAAAIAAMGAGCIPVAFSEMEASALIKHSTDGFITRKLSDFMSCTVDVYKLPNKNYTMFRQAVVAKAKRFWPKTFESRVSVLARRGLYTRVFKHAIRMSLPAMRRLLKPAAANASKVAVLVEPRQHYALEFAVRNALLHLPNDWAIHVFHGTTNQQYAIDMLSNVSNVRFTQLPLAIMDIPDYNALLKSSSFWQGMAADKVLIFQTDSVMVDHSIGDFMEFDYVGAPWHRENERWSLINKDIPQGVGNGGLSLRTTKSMLEIISRYGSTSDSSEQEDVFFAKHIERSGFRLAPRQQAYHFCMEVPCVDLQEKSGGPFALHAAWYYFRDDEKLRNMLMKAVCG